MFSIGDTVIHTGSSYGITSRSALCVVTNVQSNDEMYVKVIGHTNKRYLTPYDERHEDGFSVVPRRFASITFDEYKTRFPNAHFTENAEELVNEMVRKTKLQEEINMSTKMVKTGSTFKLSEAERTVLVDEIKTLLEEYHYHPTTEGINKILNAWQKNKGWMVELFKKHPNYNGKYQIVFDADFERLCDVDVIYHFGNYLCDYARSTSDLQEIRRGCFTYSEVKKTYERLCGVMSGMRDVRYYGYTPTANGKTYAELSVEREYWRNKIREFENDDNIYVYDGRGYVRTEYMNKKQLKNCSEYIRSYSKALADDNFAANINSYFPEVKAVAGQKTSRIVCKLCKLVGADKLSDFNKEFAKYADAINPISIKRHTIISCHPVDYLTMSFGNSWASCHTIDKRNQRKKPDNHNGMYSSGTLSYALDSSSFVFYTVHKDYNGTEFELQDKINRNMFHIGNDKLIQARVYPQCSDSADGIYKQIREVVQQIIADCLEMPNLWKNVKGMNECYKVTISKGTHYQDYVKFNNCNVSYLKLTEDDMYNTAKMTIGHNPICPHCGLSHTWEDSVECDDCYDPYAK